jgi:hypothetical protein
MLLFLGVGLLLAAVQAGVDQRVVHVGEERTEALAARFEEQQGHPPNEEELRAEVDRWVDDELAVRHARSLALDEGDPIVRRRLQQLVEGDDDTLDVQVAEPALDRTLWVALNHRFEGPFPHGTAFSLRPQQDYVELFGPDFAEGLAGLQVGVWTPLTSRYGEHEVLVTESTLAEEPLAGPRASALLESRDAGRLATRQDRREGVWVLY